MDNHEVARVSSIGLLVASIIVTIIHQPSYASDTTFSCDQSKGSPVTYAKTRDGRKIPMIRWVSSNDFPPDLKPLVRCQQVAKRFQTSYDHGVLKTIMTGKINGYSVVCAAISINDSCTKDNLLFTLRRNANAKQAVENLLNYRGLAAGKIQEQSSDDTQIYIDFNKYLNNIQSEP